MRIGETLAGTVIGSAVSRGPLGDTAAAYRVFDAPDDLDAALRGVAGSAG